MAFSPIPAFYYSFYCHKQTAFIYLSIIIAAGTASFVLNLFDWVHRKENKIIKFFILILSSIACVVGLSHILINEFVYSNYGDSYTIVPALYFFIATLLSYLMGFIFYITR
jgi:predicted membrane channel-forming protein YqfA (hemolysin III family)